MAQRWCVFVLWCHAHISGFFIHVGRGKKFFGAIQKDFRFVERERKFVWSDYYRETIQVGSSSFFWLPQATFEQNRLSINGCTNWNVNSLSLKPFWDDYLESTHHEKYYRMLGKDKEVDCLTSFTSENWYSCKFTSCKSTTKKTHFSLHFCSVIVKWLYIKESKRYVW